MGNNICILVAFQKKAFFPKEGIYLPILVGASLKKSTEGFGRKYVEDNVGDEISVKNESYCELTAMYWAWKNLQDFDIVGLCHYRRYLDFHNQCRPFFPSTSFSEEDCIKMDFTIDEKTKSNVKSGRVVVAKAERMPCTLKQNYCEYHLSTDFEVLQEVFEQNQNEKYKSAFRHVFEDGYKLYPYNIFLMRRIDFERYCEWLFPLLFEIESEINIESYSSFQKRIYGFMAERLFNIWLKAEGKDVIEKPIIFVDENIQNKIIGPRKVFRHILKDICSCCINVLYKMRKKI